MMQNINPDDFKLRPSQIVLYFVAMLLLMFICLNSGFGIWSAAMMSLGIMIVLILLEYSIVGYLEKRKRDKEWDETHSAK